jgi:hypothetical protein
VIVQRRRESVGAQVAHQHDPGRGVPENGHEESLIPPEERGC